MEIEMVEILTDPNPSNQRPTMLVRYRRQKDERYLINCLQYHSQIQGKTRAPARIPVGRSQHLSQITSQLLTETTSQRRRSRVQRGHILKDGSFSFNQ